MFQDEARFGRINGPKRCWAPKGIRPVSYCQIVREYTYAYAAVCPNDGTMDSLILPIVTAQAMSIFLEEVGMRHADEYIIMFMDRAAWHTAKTLKIPSNISIMKLPAYSPELNPTENIWDEIREKFFLNTVFSSMKTVEDKLEEALISLETSKELVKPITGFEWIVTSILNAT